MVDPVLEAWEVFRQEKEGDAMKHDGAMKDETSGDHMEG